MIKKSKRRVERALVLCSSTISENLFLVKFEDDLDFQYNVVFSESRKFEK